MLRILALGSELFSGNKPSLDEAADSPRILVIAILAPAAKIAQARQTALSKSGTGSFRIGIESVSMGSEFLTHILTIIYKEHNS